MTIRLPFNDRTQEASWVFINHKNIVAFMEELELAERHIEQNVNAKLVFFDLALKSIMLFKK